MRWFRHVLRCCFISFQSFSTKIGAAEPARRPLSIYHIFLTPYWSFHGNLEFIWFSVGVYVTLWHISQMRHWNWNFSWKPTKVAFAIIKYTSMCTMHQWDVFGVRIRVYKTQHKKTREKINKNMLRQKHALFAECLPAWHRWWETKSCTHTKRPPASWGCILGTPWCNHITKTLPYRCAISFASFRSIRSKNSVFRSIRS